MQWQSKVVVDTFGLSLQAGKGHPVLRSTIHRNADTGPVTLPSFSLVRKPGGLLTLIYFSLLLGSRGT